MSFAAFGRRLGHAGRRSLLAAAFLFTPAALILAAFLVVPPLAEAQQQVIEEIVIHGNRRIPAETVRARMYTRAGDVYDEPSLQRDFNSLWNSGFFEDVRIEREESPKGYRIHVYVREKPTIRRIEYEGLSSVTTSDVLEAYKKAKVGLSVESSFDPPKVKRAENVLRALLASHGRQFADITPQVTPIPPSSVALKFIVKEGPKVKVGDIEFVNNKALGDRALRRAMKNLKPIGVPYSLVLENLFSRTFDENKLQEDLERVRFKYQSVGYFKALVQDPKTEMRDTSGFFLFPWSKAGKAVDITIPVEEGDRFRLAKITFSGNKAITNTEALRALFPVKDGDWMNREAIAKGLESLRKAYGEYGYINFTTVPQTEIDDEKKTVGLNIDIDEGKQFYVRRIEFSGNTTTRDKVIRRELALEEGNIYNSRLWEFSVLRLNQLGYFEQLKPEDDTERRLDEQNGTVDLSLKVKEKGKNSIGLTGGVSGLSGSFVGINYETNNFLGLGETLRVEASVGSFERNILFGFTEPYLFDRPLQLGVTVFSRRFEFDQARNLEILSGGSFDVNDVFRSQFQNYSENTTGFSVTTSYPLRRSLKRVSLGYSFDTTSITTFNDLTRNAFEFLAFRDISGPDALRGIQTSRLIPSFSFSSIDSPQRPSSGRSLYIGGDIAGVGGNVSYVRPVVEWKQFIPVNKRRNVIGYRLQGTYVTGWLGREAPYSTRGVLGGENDVRGFDIQTITPYTYLTRVQELNLLNPDGTPIPLDPNNPRRGNVTVKVPIPSLLPARGDTNIIANTEYRVPIVGPVTIAAFADFGMNFVTRNSQLRLSQSRFDELNTTDFGCPQIVNFACAGGQRIAFDRELKVIGGTNYVPRASTGLELQVILPIVNAPFRIFYAYNPLRLEKFIQTPFTLDRSLFPATAAGQYSFEATRSNFFNYQFREPRKTLRFTVSTTF